MSEGFIRTHNSLSLSRSHLIASRHKIIARKHTFEPEGVDKHMATIIQDLLLGSGNQSLDIREFLDNEILNVTEKSQFT